jgi:hypothetical protein
MASVKRELWASLVHPAMSGPVFPVSVSVESDAADDYPVFVATRNGRVRRASVAHAVAPTGTATYDLDNTTQTLQINTVASAIDGDALAADTAASWVIDPDNAEFVEGDVISFSRTGGTGGGTTTVTLEIEFTELKND